MHFWICDNAGTEWVPGPDFPANLGNLRIHRTTVAGTERWVLLADANVRVNGEIVQHGFRVLRDRDEIVSGTERLFFSTERVAQVEPFAGDAVPCARCGSEISAGGDCVRCPGCGALCHQSTELPCFTYSHTCPRCPGATDLAAGFMWSPEEVGA